MDENSSPSSAYVTRTSRQIQWPGVADQWARQIELSCSENAAIRIIENHNLSNGVAVLRIERKTLTINDTPAELAVTTYRGDMYQALVRSVRPPSRR